MDRTPQDYAYTLQGEHSMRAERLRREAADLERQAQVKRTEAAWEDERAAWAGEMASALRGESA